MDGRLLQHPVSVFASPLGSRGNANGDPSGDGGRGARGLTETIIYLEMPMLGRPLFHVLYTNADLDGGYGVLLAPLHEALRLLADGGASRSDVARC